ncbi:MAG: ABC transporter substrate-binding protein [Phycisphaerales bacterium]|jgi:branched-chain amino acid transport system substrate-binding protein|nr:ABC transporter substrate-binding protein [Phycisphaerales bacterium]
MKRIAFIVLLVLAFGLTPMACKQKSGQRDNSTGDILIGEYGSMTGPTATFGQSSHEGLMLAIEQINAEGGVLGRKIKIISEDDQSKADEAVNAVQKLINRDGVVAIIGEVASKRSLAAGSVCQKYKIPMLSPASTNPEVTKTGDYIFRTCFTDDFQGKVNGQFALRRGWKNVAILTDVNNDYSKGLAHFFREVYGKSGNIVADESYREGDKDFKAQLTKIKGTNPDAVFLPGYYTDVGLILRQARVLGLNVPFFGGDGWDSPDTLTLGDVVNGCFYSNHYSPEDPRPEVQAFLKAYQAKYNKTPDAMATLGYDAARVMADAIKRAGKADPKAIRDALAQTRDFAGASGIITIDAERNAKKPAVILEIRDGKTHLVDTILDTGT